MRLTLPFQSTPDKNQHNIPQDLGFHSEKYPWIDDIELEKYDIKLLIPLIIWDSKVIQRNAEISERVQKEYQDKIEWINTDIKSISDLSQNLETPEGKWNIKAITDKTRADIKEIELERNQQLAPINWIQVIKQRKEFHQQWQNRFNDWIENAAYPCPPSTWNKYFDILCNIDHRNNNWEILDDIWFSLLKKFLYDDPRLILEHIDTIQNNKIFSEEEIKDYADKALKKSSQIGFLFEFLRCIRSINQFNLLNRDEIAIYYKSRVNRLKEENSDSFWNNYSEIKESWFISDNELKEIGKSISEDLSINNLNSFQKYYDTMVASWYFTEDDIELYNQRIEEDKQNKYEEIKNKVKLMCEDESKSIFDILINNIQQWAITDTTLMKDVVPNPRMWDPRISDTYIDKHNYKKWVKLLDKVQNLKKITVKDYLKIFQESGSELFHDNLEIIQQNELYTPLEIQSNTTHSLIFRILKKVFW